MGLPPIPGRGNGPKNGRRPLYLKNLENNQRIKVVSVEREIGVSKMSENHFRKQNMPQNEKAKRANEVEVENIRYVGHTEFSNKKDINFNQKLGKRTMVLDRCTKDMKEAVTTKSILVDQKQTKQITLEKAIMKMEKNKNNDRKMEVDELKHKYLKENIKWVEGFPVLKDRGSKVSLSPGTLDESILIMDPKSMKEISIVWRFYQGKAHKTIKKGKIHLMSQMRRIRKELADEWYEIYMSRNICDRHKVPLLVDKAGKILLSPLTDVESVLRLKKDKLHEILNMWTK